MQIDDYLLSQALLPYQDLKPTEQDGIRPAAVLLPLHQDQGEDYLLFTRRTETLRHHKGQISFPGGKFDLEDQQMMQTALRENQEELGIDPEAVKLLGSLPPFTTITHYHLYPIIGRFEWPYDLNPNPAEISEVIRVPLRHLLDPANYRLEQKHFQGQDYPIHYFDFLPHIIWGITGQILFEFFEYLLLAQPELKV